MPILSLVLTPIFKKLIDKAWDAAADEIEAIRDVHNSVINLSSRLKNLEHYFNEAEKVHGKENVDIWIDDLKEAAFDAEDILDLFATRSDRFKWKNDHASNYSVFEPAVDQFSKIWSKRETAIAVKVLSEQLDEIYKRRDEFLKLKQGYIIPESSRNQGKREAGPAVDASAIVGREYEKNKIITSLTTTDQSFEKVCVVPILGIGGVGKTTLAQLVYNDTKIQQHFELRMWVSVTNDFDLKRILTEMKQFDPEFKEPSSNSAPGLLQTTASESLFNKRFLLVIDDVWTMDPRDWDSLKGIFQSGANGSRVVVTSREHDHIKMIIPNYRNIEPLDKLSYDDSWKLFWNIAAVDGGPTKELEDIGKEIIEKCQGLPLAITAIAGTLRGKDNIKRWMNMVKDDFSKIEKKYHGTNFEILSVLKVSFDHLPSSLKPCFLLCSLFPKGHSLVKSELVKIWMAEGYLPFEENPEDSGDEYFDDLCNRSFFLRSNVRGYDVYTMHDLFHEMAVFVSDGSCLQLKDESSTKIENKPRHISLQCENIENPTLEVISEDQKQKVRTILIPGDNLRIVNTLEDLFRSLKFIRVLDLSSSSIDELPDLFKELHLLRYLDLSKTGIRILPKSICDLWNLQTLRLLHCLRLIELPKDLSKLVSLRHLELDERFWLNLSELPPGAGNLTNLQTLTKFWVRRKKGYEINELGNLNSLTGKLHLLGLENVDNNAGEAKLHKKENLDHLVFEWTKQEERPAPVNDTNTLSGLKPHSNIKNLYIINFGGIEFPAWISNGLLKNLTTLSLNHCTNCSKLSLGEVRKLKKIYLTDMPELEEWIPEKGNLWVLNPQTLEISSCPKLRILPEKFEDLRTLEIKECGSLQNLPSVPSLTSLTLIDNASLENWNKNIAIRRPIVMKLQSCPKLKAYPDHVCVSKLDISDCGECGKQKDLPPAKNPKPTEHLTHMKLNGSLTNLSPHSNSLMTLQLSDISQLSSLNDLPRLLMLKALYINGCNDLKHLWEEDGDLQSLTPALTYLSVKICPNLITLTESRLPAKLEALIIALCTDLVSLGSDVTFKDLMSLKNINIENCHSLTRLPVDSFPSSLKHLKFVDCPQLKEIVNNIPGSSDRKIEFLNGTNKHEPKPEPAVAAQEPEMESDTVVNSTGTESLPVKRSDKCCCLIM